MNERKNTIPTIGNINNLPITLTVEQITTLLGISRVTAYNLVHKKGFPVLKCGKRLIIPTRAFLQYIENNEISA